jgi:signal transduction histidine kinase
LYLWTPFPFSLHAPNAVEAFDLVLFIVVGLMMSAIVAVLDSTKRKLQERTAELANEVAHRAKVVERLRTVQNILDATLPQGGTQDLLAEMLRRTRAALHGDSATVLLLQDDDQLKAVASDGAEDVVEAGLAVPVGEGLIGRIAISRTGTVFDDLTGTSSNDPVLSSAIRAIAGVPLRIRDRLVGVMYVGSATAQQFTKDDLLVLRLVAERAAVAIERIGVHEVERASRIAAEEAVQAKTMFLAMVSHELRSPLQAILGAVQVLKKSASLPRQMETFVDLIARNARTQSRLVSDLVDMSRIATGHLSLQVEKTTLRPLVEMMIESMQGRFDAKRLNVHWTKSGPDRLVWVDPERIQQIVSNLLINAAKFTDPGGWIKIHLDERDPQVVELSVSDSGAGMDAELLATMFVPFQQGRNVSGRRGLGLGLAIVKSLVELHGGTICANSEGLGCGSVFSVRLPTLTFTKPGGPNVFS